jgi:DNA-binding response OmpR family regulator
MKRVLLVEDDVLVSQLLEEVLHTVGCHVDCCTNFADGRTKLENETFDLLVCDVLLPGGHGTELAALAQSRGVKCLLVTGAPNQMPALERVQHPRLIKPFRPAEFVRQITAMLGDAS